MAEMNSIASRIDKSKEQYDSFNQLTQLLHKEVGAIIKVLQMQNALDHQDDVDRESIFLMGMRDAHIDGAENPNHFPQIKNTEDMRK